MICEHESLAIKLNISHLLTKVYDQSFQFSFSHLFALSLNVKQFYLTHS